MGCKRVEEEAQKRIKKEYKNEYKRAKRLK